MVIATLPEGIVFMKLVFSFVMVALTSGVFGCESTGTTRSPWREDMSLMVVTQRSIVNEQRPVMVVIRNSADGHWLVFTDENPGVDPQITVSFKDLVALDETIKEVADLPYGWRAWRSGKGEPWDRRRDLR
jgi:hypothetical protein